jgi:hypothetical protein
MCRIRDIDSGKLLLGFALEKFGKIAFVASSNFISAACLPTSLCDAGTITINVADDVDVEVQMSLKGRKWWGRHVILSGALTP